MNDYMRTIISGLKQWVSAQITKSKSDWNQSDSNATNYIKNRTHYTEIAEITVLSNKTINDTSFVLRNPLIKGNVYTITFNDVVYQCVAKEYDGYIMIGNNALYEYDNGTEPDTGEPFAIECSKGDTDAWIYLDDSITSAPTVSIACVGEIIHKLDQKYLPDTVVVNSDLADVATSGSYYDLPDAPDVSTVVKYSSQSLTNSQKAQARENIGAGVPSIIDVTSLPTENIDKNSFYRLLKGTIVHNKALQTANIVHIVNGLPEIGEPVTADMVHVVIYYNTEDGLVYCYVNDTLSVVASVPVGWYAIEMLAPTMGVTWNGVITNINDDPCDDTTRLLLHYVLYSYDNGWTEHNVQIGWRGTGSGAEIFNSIKNIASGSSSHAEGSDTQANGWASHSEGINTIAENIGSHAEGEGTKAEGRDSHAEGYNSYAEDDYSHAEGYNTKALGNASHAEGGGSQAEGNYSHAEGNYSHANGWASHAEGDNSYANGSVSHVEGRYSHALGDSSHAEGQGTKAEGNYSHAEGYYSIAMGEYSHAEGYGSHSSTHITGDANALTYTIDASYATEMTGRIIKYNDVYVKIISHNINTKTITVESTLSETALSNVEVSILSSASGDASHVEGMSSNASGKSSHAEGWLTTAIGESSHAEGQGTCAKGEYSHAEGWHNTASGKSSHVEGWHNTASGACSHAEGNNTIANGVCSHVQGEWNIPDYNGTTYAHIVGNGKGENSRSNAHTIDWEGNAWFASDVYVGGTGQEDTAAKILATQDYVNEKIDANQTIIDSTLSMAGKAADSKAVGDALTQKSQVRIVIWEADD